MNKNTMERDVAVAYRFSRINFDDEYAGEDVQAEFDAWLRSVKAEVLREFAKKVYNGAPAQSEANFQAFYNYGLHPVLMAEADRIEFGTEEE